MHLNNKRVRPLRAQGGATGEAGPVVGVFQRYGHLL